MYISRLSTVLTSAMCLTVAAWAAAPAAQAGIVLSGDTSPGTVPANPDQAASWPTEIDIANVADGSGGLTVDGGSQMADTRMFLATAANSTGTLTVTGTSSKLELSSWLRLADTDQATGQLVVEAGGVVSVNGDIHAGYMGGYGSGGASGIGSGLGIILVQGQGSQLTTQGQLALGRTWSSGTLDIEAGGYVQSASADIGGKDRSASTATIGSATAFTSTWNNLGNLHVGGGDNVRLGELNINVGGRVQVGSGVSGGDLILESGSPTSGLSDPARGKAIVNLSGGALDLNGHDVTVTHSGDGQDAYFNFTDGTLANVANFDAADLNADLAAYPSQQDGVLYQQGGTLQIGADDATGAMTVAGDYDLASAGVIEIDLAGHGGVAGTDFDVLTVTGNADLAGTIAVNLLGSFEPIAGESFEVLNFASLTDGGYTLDVNDAGLAPGLSWDTSSFATTGTISVAPVPEPATGMVVLVGLGGLLMLPRRKREEVKGS